MSQQERKYLHIQSRTDTKEEWYNINPKLLEREIGYEKNTGQYKIGDGETLWRDLPYAHNIENGEGQFSLQQLSNQAKGNYSYAEGFLTTASGDYSHTEGLGDKISNKIFEFKYEKNGVTVTAKASMSELQPTIIAIDTNNSETLTVAFQGAIKVSMPIVGTISLNANDLLKLSSVQNAIAEALIYVDNGCLIELENKILLMVKSVDTTNINNNKLVLRLNESYNNGNINELINEKIADIYTGVAYGVGSHLEGYNNTALGDYSHAEGKTNTASGEASHVEGDRTIAKGTYSHTEGYNTKTTGKGAHAEGFQSHANGDYSHSEGRNTSTLNEGSHAEGYGTKAYGDYSHAEGYGTTVSGENAHAEGYKTIADSANQHVEGKFNIKDAEDKYVHIVGNGKKEDTVDETTGEIITQNRSNAYTLDWKGNGWFAGNILSQAPDSNLNCALSAPLYVGTFHMDWNAIDILGDEEGSKWPEITLSFYDQLSKETVTKTGTIQQIFNPELYDIIIGWDDNSIKNHFESIAEAGIQILSDGQIYIFNKEVEDVNFWEQTLGVNITIYYTGGGAINVSNE